MDARVNRSRRRFMGRAAMTLAGARFGMFGTAAEHERESRQLAALGRATAWLHSPPLSSSSLAGQVALVQFGTYTCINWLRTLPYVRAWARTYGPRLHVIVVHTPEFAFERDLENVRRELRRLPIDCPVAVDNDYAIWRAFDNRYWPALYLIDGRGRVRHQHFGEGDYDRSEKAIQRLLSEAGAPSADAGMVAGAASAIEAAADWQNLKSPEIYLGSDRTTNFSSPGGAAPGRRRLYAAGPRLPLNHWALAGQWTMADQPVALNTAPGRIVCRFHARDVHLVMGPPRRQRPARFRLTIDRQPPGAAHGADVDDTGSGTAVDQRLYQLVRQRGPIVDRTVEIEFLDAGVEAYAFTFG